MEFSFDLCHCSFCELEKDEPNEPKDKSKQKETTYIDKNVIVSQPIDIPFSPPEINYLE